MRSVTSLAMMQRLARDWRRRGRRIAFVPTMGYLHDGHLSLIHRARALVGARGRVVVSIFVNPAQFGPREDLARYPRDPAGDARRCRSAGVDVLFLPRTAAMYPPGRDAAFSTWVTEDQLSQRMEGASRPTHFRGVTTVVAKLLNLVQPDVAVFGAKDYQQAAVVKRMVRDLNFPVRIVVAPTQREPDGLAMSSRNKYLRGHQRAQARILFQALRLARARARGTRSALTPARLRSELQRWIERQPDARVDYVEFFDPGTLRPATRVGRGVHMALAVFVGRTRLIDNARL